MNVSLRPYFLSLDYRLRQSLTLNLDSHDDKHLLLSVTFRQSYQTYLLSANLHRVQISNWILLLEVRNQLTTLFLHTQLQGNQLTSHSCYRSFSSYPLACEYPLFALLSSLQGFFNSFFSSISAIISSFFMQLL